MKRDSFVFYRSFLDAIGDLPRDIQGEVLTAIVEYGLNGVTTESPKPITKVVMNLVKPQIDKNYQRFINGKKGGNPNFKKGSQNPYYPTPKKDNQKITEGLPKDNQTITEGLPNDNVNVYNNTVYNIKSNKLLFVQIKNLNKSLNDFQGKKEHLFIAYRFWELWAKDNPDNQTIKKADAYVWSNEVRKLLDNDGVKVERLVAIYSYFVECSKGTAGFRDFWFKTIKSPAGLRKKNKFGEFNIDRIAEEVNKHLEIDQNFAKSTKQNIEKFKEYAKSSTAPER